VTPEFEFEAIFYTSLPTSGPCTTETSGACTYTACRDVPVYASAGTLSIAEVGSPFSVSVPYSGRQYDYQVSRDLLTAGQTFTVTATGATVPAFGPVAVAAPQPVALVAPAPASSAGFTLSTSADLVVEWTGGQSDAQMIFQAGGGGGDNGVSCSWNGAAGQGTVPAALLAPLAPHDGLVLYGQYKSTSVETGSYPVQVIALTHSLYLATFK
jgi:hypothetical protein